MLLKKGRELAAGLLVRAHSVLEWKRESDIRQTKMKRRNSD